MWCCMVGSLGLWMWMVGVEALCTDFEFLRLHLFLALTCFTVTKTAASVRQQKFTIREPDSRIKIELRVKKVLSRAAEPAPISA